MTSKYLRVLVPTYFQAWIKQLRGQTEYFKIAKFLNGIINIFCNIQENIK